ncbi:MAG: hypothetical protein ACE5DY_02050, partial [Mariprofundaceae bacterium]
MATCPVAIARIDKFRDSLPVKSPNGRCYLQIDKLSPENPAILVTMQYRQLGKTSLQVSEI